ncbi:two-component system chemotaxis response regulator CheY [Mesorhizobium soli]|jgi:two-component system chemotaxis response regulator CheY|uniref:response regulator n=1 Tax=Pseudaminobacter soli (ex Li et al. 2025) TaxID=1295366 RepID=UPI0024730836|nr:response regulator [Mesorhizobium soli]MDH6235248.1 two-component system chemotaxis response regulator CheY [Mesorhizobium soli]
MSFLQHFKVLVVDDTTTSRILISESLQDMGIRQITLAKDGEHALRTIMAQPQHLVISDFNMPNLDGLGLLKAIRSYAPTRNTPFIILTGKSDRALLERAAALGVNNYLTKPFTTAQLKRAIEQIVGDLR